MLEGVNTPSYNVAGGTFAYNSATFTATWTLPAAIPDDKLLLELNADGADPIRRRPGQPVGRRVDQSRDHQRHGHQPVSLGQRHARQQQLPFPLQRAAGQCEPGRLCAGAGRAVGPRGPGVRPPARGTTRSSRTSTATATVLASDGLLVLGRLGTSLPAGQPMATAFPRRQAIRGAVSSLRHRRNCRRWDGWP